MRTRRDVANWADLVRICSSALEGVRARQSTTKRKPKRNLSFPRQSCTC